MAKTLVRQLIDDYGVKKEQIAIDTGATVRSVERWYDGENEPLNVYREKMERMIEERKGAKL